jgi:hypothetical protein
LCFSLEAGNLISCSFCSFAILLTFYGCSFFFKDKAFS